MCAHICNSPLYKSNSSRRLISPAVENTAIQEELNLPNKNSSIGINDQRLNRRKNVLGAGLGYANAFVLPNSDNQYNDGKKLNLSLGLSTEYTLTPYFALTARADMSISLGYRLLSGVDTSVDAAATAGIMIGKIRQPGQIYLSVTAGPGFAHIGDRGLDEDGEQDCLLCTTKKGGSSAGLTTRLAIGRTGKFGGRFELVYIRNGGNGNNNDYSNNEEAFIETVLIQVSSASS